MAAKTFLFDISVDAWIRNIEIEADSYEEALQELRLMSLEELIDKGFVKDFDISNIGVEEYGDDEVDEYDDFEYHEDE